MACIMSIEFILRLHLHLHFYCFHTYMRGTHSTRKKTSHTLSVQPHATATENEPAIPPELIKLELAKWVKRSTAGSFISLTAFITWIIVFQLNKDSFGPKWFVMSQEEEALTGW